MRSLERAIREVEPGSAYPVNACHYEALWSGVAVALFFQEQELLKISERTDPPVLRFVAVEEIEALWEFAIALEELMDRA